MDDQSGVDTLSAPLFPETMFLASVEDEGLSGLSPGPEQANYAAKFRSPCARPVLEELVPNEASPPWKGNGNFFSPGPISIKTASSLCWGDGVGPQGTGERDLAGWEKEVVEDDVMDEDEGAQSGGDKQEEGGEQEIEGQYSRWEKDDKDGRRRNLEQDKSGGGGEVEVRTDSNCEGASEEAKGPATR